MSNKKIIIGASIVAVLFLVLVGGAIILSSSTALGGSIKIGYVKNQYGNNINASFAYFNGSDSKKINLKSGQDIKFVYDIDIEQGSLEIVIHDELGNEVASCKNGKGEVVLNVDKSQKYNIVTTGDKAKGKYNISWEEN